MSYSNSDVSHEGLNAFVGSADELSSMAGGLMGGGTYLEDFTEHELVVMGEMIDKARRDRYFGYKRKGMPKHKFIEFLQDTAEKTGVVSGAEKKAFWRNLERRQDELFDAIDEDNDSYIREEEFIRNYRRVRDEFYHFDNVYDERPYFWESSKEKYEHYVRQEDKSTDLAARYIKASINDEVLKLNRMSKWHWRVLDFSHTLFWFYFMFFITMFHSLLATVETGNVWSKDDTPDDISHNRNISAIELLLLAIYWVDIGLRWFALGTRVFFGLHDREEHEKAARREERKRQGWVSRLLVASVTVITIELLFTMIASLPRVRVMRALRPFIVFLYDPRLRFLGNTILRSLKSVLYIAVLVSVIIISYSCLGIQFFAWGNNENVYTEEVPAVCPPNVTFVNGTLAPGSRFEGVEMSPNGTCFTRIPLESNFDNIFNASLSLFVLATTENYPDIMYPSLKVTFWTVWYFVSYIVIVIFILLQVLTAAMFDAYSKHMAQKVLRRKRRELKGFVAAFQVLALTEAHRNIPDDEMVGPMLVTLDGSEESRPNDSDSPGDDNSLGGVSGGRAAAERDRLDAEARAVERSPFCCPCRKAVRRAVPHTATKYRVPASAVPDGMVQRVLDLLAKRGVLRQDISLLHVWHSRRHEASNKSGHIQQSKHKRLYNQNDDGVPFASKNIDLDDWLELMDLVLEFAHRRRLEHLPKILATQAQQTQLGRTFERLRDSSSSDPMSRDESADASGNDGSTNSSTSSTTTLGVHDRLADFAQSTGQGVTGLQQKLNDADRLIMHPSAIMSVASADRSDTFLDNPYEHWWFSRTRVQLFTTSTGFRVIVAAAIVINIMALASYYKGMSDEFGDFLEIVDYCTYGIFVVEMVLLMYALSPGKYWASNWNRLDAFVVICSGLGIIFVSILNAAYANETPYYALRIARSISLLRILKIVQVVEGFKPLILTVIGIRATIMRLLLVVAICMYSYAMIGMALFEGRFDEACECNPTDVNNPGPNFNTFSWAMLTLFQVYTQSNWHEILFLAMRARGVVAVVYFVSYYIIFCILLGNIMVAIVWEVFSVEQRSAVKYLMAFKKLRTLGKVKREWEKEIKAELEEIQNQHDAPRGWEERMVREDLEHDYTHMSHKLIREIAPQQIIVKYNQHQKKVMEELNGTVQTTHALVQEANEITKSFGGKALHAALDRNIVDDLDQIMELSRRLNAEIRTFNTKFDLDEKKPTVVLALESLDGSAGDLLPSGVVLGSSGASQGVRRRVRRVDRGAGAHGEDGDGHGHDKKHDSTVGGRHVVVKAPSDVPKMRGGKLPAEIRDQMATAKSELRDEQGSSSSALARVSSSSGSSGSSSGSASDSSS